MIRSWIIARQLSANEHFVPRNIGQLLCIFIQTTVLVRSAHNLLTNRLIVLIHGRSRNGIAMFKKYTILLLARLLWQKTFVWTFEPDLLFFFLLHYMKLKYQLVFKRIINAFILSLLIPICIPTSNSRER